MNKVLKDSLVRKNRQMYKTALRAIEKVMGPGFVGNKQFTAMRSMILTAGNEIERSIKTEVDQYVIVLKDGETPVAVSTSEYIISMVPQIKFGIDQRLGKIVPFLKLVSQDEEEDLSLLREIFETGIVSRQNGYPCFEVRGTVDCMQAKPVMDEIMKRLQNPPDYVEWVESLHALYAGDDVGDKDE